MRKLWLKCNYNGICTAIWRLSRFTSNMPHPLTECLFLQVSIYFQIPGKQSGPQRRAEEGRAVRGLLSWLIFPPGCPIHLCSFNIFFINGWSPAINNKNQRRGSPELGSIITINSLSYRYIQKNKWACQ